MARRGGGGLGVRVRPVGLTRCAARLMPCARGRPGYHSLPGRRLGGVGSASCGRIIAMKASLSRSTSGRAPLLVVPSAGLVPAPTPSMCPASFRRRISICWSAIAGQPDVLYAEPDRMERLVRTVNQAKGADGADPVRAQRPVLRPVPMAFHGAAGGINAPDAWTFPAAMASSRRAGYRRVPHPDLQANLLEGYDFITNTFVSRRPTTAPRAGRTG